MNKKQEEKRKVYKIKDLLKIKRKDGLRMRTVDEFTMRSVLKCSVSRNYNYPALKTWRQNDEITYATMEKYVQNVGSYLYKIGLKQYDKVAIMAHGSPNWMISYFAITSGGLTAVPVLPDFSTKEVCAILRHADCKAAFVETRLGEKVFDAIKENNIELFRLDDLFYIPQDIAKHIDTNDDFILSHGNDTKNYRRTEEEIGFWNEITVKEEDIASLIYTSGTMGIFKGVMLTHKSLVWNADMLTDAYIHIKHKYKALSILPMSHVYEFTLGQILFVMSGAEIVYLGRTPVPSILLPALKEVKPISIFTVPLLVEKIYKSKILPLIEKNKKIVYWYNKKLTHKMICRIIARKMLLTFGGNLKLLGIGGAILDKEVEKFLYDAKFPYAQGYGLTETSPLVALNIPRHKQRKLFSCGKVLAHTEIKLLNKNKEGVGEILVKGPSVMKCYYKNEELTKASFTEDGFFKTGDLGKIDKKGWVYIMGRTKTIILGASGENIYPESIEGLINNQEFVQESLVVPEKGCLVALIKLDLKTMAGLKNISLIQAKEEANEYLDSIKNIVNKELPLFSKIILTKLQEEPFVRTPTQKIKRFLYYESDNAKNNDSVKINS